MLLNRSGGLNPLDYAYNEINAPRHMKLPKPVLDDTDGDGVPDFKDKELITPTQCQPVDADGVGKCPDPQCCKDLKAYIDSNGGGLGHRCNVGDLPSITFKRSAAELGPGKCSHQLPC
jgi:OOP family OmpA-OmpF porin